MTADEDGEREQQAALSEALRREVQERRLEGVEDRQIEFLCECQDPGCSEFVSMTLNESDFVRRVPNRLVVKVGHTDCESERVLMEEPGRFQVVERFGPSDDVVAHIAPRIRRARNRRGRAA